MHSAQNTHDSTDTTQTRGFDAYAKEQTPEQYRAGVHYEDKQQTVTRKLLMLYRLADTLAC